MMPPAWDAPTLNAGTMVRGALWLVQVIGEGNSFTKEQLRAAFPGISQADRRVRDLRKFGWVILTNAQDASLSAEDQRFVQAGVPVWDPAARREAASGAGPTSKEKQAILARDNYMCTVCGISGGEPYPDGSGHTAVLSVCAIDTVLPSGATKKLLATFCKECRAGSNRRVERADEVLAAIEGLDQGDRGRLVRWMTRGRRTAAPLDKAWSRYLRLPPDARDEITSKLTS